jgi:hypothetical protein
VTKADPTASSWVINDAVTRLRVVGSERVFDLAGADRLILGTSSECSLRIDDPTDRVSRRHAALVRDGDIWTMHDQGSTNGIRQNGEDRRSLQLAPGDEIDLTGIKLIAESRRSMELHDLLRRWLGWSTARLDEVDRAFREVREAAHLRAALILRGDGSLTGIARRLHRVTLGERPFVALGPGDRGMEGLELAITGTLCINASKLPRDFHLVVLNLRTPDTCARLVACADNSASIDGLATRISRISTIWIPPLATRANEIDRVLEAYGADAVEAFDARHLGFRPQDLEGLRAWGVSTFDEIEEDTRRLVALRNYGVSEGANRLGIHHSSLTRWAQRRHLPT